MKHTTLTPIARLLARKNGLTGRALQVLSIRRKYTIVEIFALEAGQRELCPPSRSLGVWEWASA